MIKCAHCKDRHETVSQVRACAFGSAPTGKLAALATTASAVAATLPQPKILSRVKPTEPGMYKVGDAVYRVVWNKAKTALYANKLVTTLHGGKVHKLSFQYDKGAIFRIDARDRMTVAEVEALGQTTGHCWVCGKKLTVQERIVKGVKSGIKAGIGPVCAKRV